MNETLQTIHALHTTHGDFGPREVSESDLQAILHASVRAANASARQSYSIIVVDDRDTQRALCGYAGSQLLVYCVDFTRINDTARRMGHESHASGVAPFVTAAVDAMLAVQTAVIAARSLGIDSLITNGVHRGDMDRVYRLLDLPEEGCFPLIAVVLGYGEKPPVKKGRLEGAGVVHRGKHRRLTDAELDELVRSYDDPELHLALDDKWRAQGMSHYLDWYYTVWAVRPGSSVGRSHMSQILERAGFLE